MTDFTRFDPLEYKQKSRPNQRDILPTAIKSRSFSQITIGKTDFSLGFFTLNNLNTVITSARYVSLLPNEVIIGTVPFQFAYLEGTTLATALVIPTQSGRDYKTYGPYCLPTFESNTVRGSTIKNLRFMVAIYNNTGAQRSIIRMVQTRYIMGGAGTVGFGLL